MSDLIFWYTGATIWAIIAIAIAIGVGIAFLMGCVQTYRYGRRLKTINTLLSISNESQREIMKAFENGRYYLSKEEVEGFYKVLQRVSSEWHFLKSVKTRPYVEKEYEIDDHVKIWSHEGKIVERTKHAGAIWYDIRTDDDILIKNVHTSDINPPDIMELP